MWKSTQGSVSMAVDCPSDSFRFQYIARSLYGLSALRLKIFNSAKEKTMKV